MKKIKHMILLAVFLIQSAKATEVILLSYEEQAPRISRSVVMMVEKVSYKDHYHYYFIGRKPISTTITVQGRVEEVLLGPVGQQRLVSNYTTTPSVEYNSIGKVMHYMSYSMPDSKIVTDIKEGERYIFSYQTFDPNQMVQQHLRVDPLSRLERITRTLKKIKQ